MDQEDLNELAMRGVHVQAAQERLAAAERQRDSFEFEKALEDLAALNEDQARLEEALSQLKEQATKSSAAGEVSTAVVALVRRGLLLGRLERRLEGLEDLDRALELAEEEGDFRLRLAVQRRRARALGAMGRLAEAEEVLAGLLAETGPQNRTERSRLLAQKGDLYLASGRSAEAQEAYEQAGQVAGADSEEELALRLQLGMGRAALAQDDLESAIQTLERAQELAAAVGDYKREREVLHELQAVDLALGRVEDYLEHCRALRRIAEEQRDHIEGAMQRENQVAALVELGRQEEALTLLHESLEYVRRRGPRMKKSVLMNHLGNLYLEMGRMEQAEGTFQDVLEEAREQNNPRAMAVALGRLGALYAEQGKLEAAERYGGLAVEKADEALDPEIAAEQHVLFALTLRDLDEIARSHESTRKALALFERAGRADMVERTRELLAELGGPEA